MILRRWIAASAALPLAAAPALTQEQAADETTWNVSDPRETAPRGGLLRRHERGGWSPLQALRAGTITPARALGFEGDFGRRLLELAMKTVSR